MNWKLLTTVIVTGLLGSALGQAGVLQTLGSNTPYDIDGHYVVGVRSNGLSFLYNDLTQTYTTLPFLDGLPTSALSISAGKIAGVYSDNVGTKKGFIYSLSSATYTTLVHPLAAPGILNGTKATGIDGDNVVGNYVDSAGKQHGFLYDIGTETWTTLDYSGASSTSLTGISGNLVVASVGGGAGRMYDLDASTWTSIPLLNPKGIDGNNIVGFWPGGTPDGAAIYNLVDDTYVNPLIGVDFPPGQIVRSTTFNGIDGNTLVGMYNYWNGSFFANSGFDFNGVPEAGTLTLTAVGAVGFAFLWMRRMRDRKSR